MKKVFFIVVTFVVILLLLICSCDQGSEDVEVKTVAKLTGYYYDSNGQIINGPIPNVKVRFDIDTSKGSSTFYEVTGEDGMTIDAVNPGGGIKYELKHGEQINIRASVDDASLPSDAYGSKKPWNIKPVNHIIPYDSLEAKGGYASPVLELFRDTFPFPITTSNTTAASKTTTITTTGMTNTQTAQSWSLKGNWVMKFVVTNAQGQAYSHDYTITNQTGGTFSGTGGNPSGGPYLHKETISGTIGETVNAPITIHVTYTDNSYTVDLTGTIDNNGKISGTWQDNYKPQNTGVFSTVSGVATPIK